MSPDRFSLHSPPLPIPYGTHHSKFFLILYERGIRVAIHTANLLHRDCTYKTQAREREQRAVLLYPVDAQTAARCEPLMLGVGHTCVSFEQRRASMSRTFHASQAALAMATARRSSRIWSST